MGVPAFFSGCVTTTINTVFPDLDAKPPADAPIGYVDVTDLPPGAVTYRHSEGVIRRRPFVGNVRYGLELLETYRHKHRKLRHLAAALLPAGPLDRHGRRLRARATARTCASTG